MALFLQIVMEGCGYVADVVELVENLVVDLHNLHNKLADEVAHSIVIECFCHVCIFLELPHLFNLGDFLRLILHVQLDQVVD